MKKKQNVLETTCFDAINDEFAFLFNKKINLDKYILFEDFDIGFINFD